MEKALTKRALPVNGRPIMRALQIGIKFISLS